MRVESTRISKAGRTFSLCSSTVACPPLNAYLLICNQSSTRISVSETQQDDGRWESQIKKKIASEARRTFVAIFFIESLTKIAEVSTLALILVPGPWRIFCKGKNQVKPAHFISTVNAHYSLQPPLPSPLHLLTPQPGRSDMQVSTENCTIKHTCKAGKNLECNRAGLWYFIAPQMSRVRRKYGSCRMG